MTRELAGRINETAAPGDRVSDGALHYRVLRNDGSIIANRNNDPVPECESNAPGDKVSGRQLESRVYRQENHIPTNRGNNPASECEPIS